MPSPERALLTKTLLDNFVTSGTAAQVGPEVTMVLFAVALAGSPALTNAEIEEKTGLDADAVTDAMNTLFHKRLLQPAAALQFT